MKVTAAVTESSIDADDERTCFTQTPRVSGRTLAGEAVDQVCARASVLARMWGTFIDVYGGKKQNELFYVLFCVFFKLVSRTTKKKCGQQLTNLTSSTAETSQTRASEGGVARNAVVDALASVQAGPQVRTHWCCRERDELQGIGHEGQRECFNQGWLDPILRIGTGSGSNIEQKHYSPFNPIPSLGIDIGISRYSQVAVLSQP